MKMTKKIIKNLILVLIVAVIGAGAFIFGGKMKEEITIKVKFFNLKYTLECGQCFRWKEVEEEENTYIGVIKDRVIKIKQEEDKLLVRSNNMENLEQVVTEYFDLNKDYQKIEQEISSIDNHVKEAVKRSSGLRLLNQDFFETLISYIISANNNIPRISKSVNEISKRYGKKIIFENEEYYLFPTAQELENVSIDEYRKCGVGFRDSYIYSTVKDILEGKFDIYSINDKKTATLRKELLNLKGVGPKVADCILLFACGRGEVFPIDVWVERVMSVLYFKETNGKMKKRDILEYAYNNFKDYAGIVQQHLFYNMREKMI